MSTLLSDLPHSYKGFIHSNEKAEPGSNENSYIYYADLNKRWPFYTNTNGAKLLVNMFKKNDSNVQQCQDLIDSSPDRDKLENEGREIYAAKPNKVLHSVSFTAEDYNHPGFFKQYLILKSIQRYAEFYSLTQRAYNKGYFTSYVKREKEALKNNTADSLPPIRILSMDGGPGYELLAMRDFIQSICPSSKFDIISLDALNIWEPICKNLNISFHQYDMNNDSHSIQEILYFLYKKSQPDSTEVPISALHVDFVIYSYSYLLNYTRPDHNCHIAAISTLNPFKNIESCNYHTTIKSIEELGDSNCYTPSKVELREKITFTSNKCESSLEPGAKPTSPSALFINDRSTKIPSLPQFILESKEHLKVVYLLSQHACRDDRNIAISSREFVPPQNLYNTPDQMELIFPNQPYEEFKSTSQFKYFQKVKHSAKGAENNKKAQYSNSKQAVKTTSKEDAYGYGGLRERDYGGL